jgi:hypothetical protein
MRSIAVSIGRVANRGMGVRDVRVPDGRRALAARRGTSAATSGGRTPDRRGAGGRAEL